MKRVLMIGIVTFAWFDAFAMLGDVVLETLETRPRNVFVGVPIVVRCVLWRTQLRSASLLKQRGIASSQ